MDKRKLKFGGGLHRNVIGSQLSTRSSSQSQSSEITKLRDKTLASTQKPSSALSKKDENDDNYTSIIDKRKFATKGNLHKNDVSNQLSSQSSNSNVSTQSTASNNVILTQKRKSSTFISQEERDNKKSTKVSGEKSTNSQSSSKSEQSEILASHQFPNRKRKSSSSFNKDDSDEDLGDPLAESTVLKKQRNESKLLHEISQYEVVKNKPRTSPRKGLSGNRKTFAETFGRFANLKTPVQDDAENSIPSSPEHEQPIVKKKHLSKKAGSTENRCKFIEFLDESGITLNADGRHVLNKDLIIVQQNMKKLLCSGKYKKEEIMKLIEKYIENQKNLDSALDDLEIAVNDNVTNVLRSSSLIRMLLQVSELHPEIYTILLDKLNQAVVVADSMDAVPWTRLLLHQFRFLDVVIKADILSAQLEQLLESSPEWFQSELLLFLPDIVCDKQHQIIAETLNKLMEDNNELTSLILNCMSNLNLGKEYTNEYRDKVLGLLKTNIKMNDIPAIVKFALEDFVTSDVVKNTLTALRNTELQPLPGDNLDDCYKNQLEIINILKMHILISKDIVNATFGVIKSIAKDPMPLDIILLLIIYSTTVSKKKGIETMFKQHIRSGFYRQSLLSLLYNDYKQVVQEVQLPASQIASILLKTDERVFVNFAIDWFRLQFISNKDAVFKQRELLEKMLLLMGKNEQTAKNVLSFLCRMVETDEERQCLVPHCNHLRILLDKLDNLSLEDVGTLNDVLHNLCANSNSMSESLRDDLFILIQKQVSAVKPLTKCKGVLGAVMAIKHLMKKADTSDAALDLFKTTLTSVKNCQKSQTLFYDHLARVISVTEEIDNGFIQEVADYIEEEFVNTYMTDKASYKGELIPKFGLNNAEDEPQNCVLNFGSRKYGALIPISFKLLRTCCVRLSKDGELDAIDALLGCAILMPENINVPEEPVLDLIICSINWCREVINAFVTQNDRLLRKQVLQRLDNLIYLQGELSILLSLCDSRYQPVPCYFHRFPVPHFIYVDKKIKKKGKKSKKGSVEKSPTLVETEVWEKGSTLCLKNPTYFRKLDAAIAHLLDIKMELHTSQSAMYTISLPQVSFVVKELLGVIEHDCTETFMRDLITLLPKICAKLRDIVETLREESTHESRGAMKLLLCLFIKIFNWKGFETVTYNALLREGLRTLAGQINEANGMLRSCKELVAESYKYFESLVDIATDISIAIALINVCQALMKHSESYTKENKEKHAKTAYSFLCLEWPEDKHYSPLYKSAVTGLLNNWIDNEPLPLKTVTIMLEWLPDNVSKLEKLHDSLNRLPTIRRNNFHVLYKKMFDGIIKGVKIGLSQADTDPERITLWHSVGSSVQKLVEISKTLKTKNNVLIFLKNMPVLLRIFLNVGMPVLEHNLKYQTDDITNTVKMMQAGTRYLHAICCDSIEKKDMTLTKFVPAAKSMIERLIYSVKGMLVLNNSSAAFWMGNLVNKNLDGCEILSQSSSAEPSTVANSDIITDDANDVSSEVLDSESSNDEPLDEVDDVP